MAVKIRLARYGAKKKPFYRVVATESRSPRDGRFIEIVGTYDPRNKATGINLDVRAIREWMSKGAELTASVQRLMKNSAPAAANE
jgi:small subunit ribosomal protein S16